MARYNISLSDADTGRALRYTEGWTAEIVQPGTATLITIYSNKELTTPQANPILLNDMGDVGFYAQSSTQFDISIKKNGVEKKRVPNQEMVGSDG